MGQHLWGDETFDWKSLDEAIDLITDFSAKWGRMGGASKEKWGECRFYASFGLSLHSLIFPRYFYYKHPSFPDFLWKFDCLYAQPFFQLTGIQRLWIKWQQWVYREAHKRAIAKYPHIREEILGAPDYPELLEGL